MSERFSWISGSLAQTVLSFLIVALSACGAPDTSEKVTLPKKQARKVAVIAHRGALALPQKTRWRPSEKRWTLKQILLR